MKNKIKINKIVVALACIVGTLAILQSIVLETNLAYAQTTIKMPRSFADFEATPPIHTSSGASITTSPQGLTPSNIKYAYHLPATGGKGTIAIVTAYNHPSIESDLAVFDKQFGLASCTVANKCLEIHPMSSSTKTDAGWSLESALDSEWAHAIAPKAKLLIVEAASTKGSDLLKAIDYARARSDVTSISMSWGGDEFSDEATLDKHFLGIGGSTGASTGTTPHTVAFFASSGDDGSGVSWPAVSPNVIAVGGTSLAIDPSGHFVSEKAWSGSGGGASAFEPAPSFQISYSIPRSNNKRAIPDVSFAADPVYGFSVYHVENPAKNSTKNPTNSSDNSGPTNNKGWYVVGGTSAGAPQWAAINSLGQDVSLAKLYKDKSGSVYATFFRDIVSGKNGTCAYYCNARARYDYVTGLGSPITYKF